MAGWPLGCQRPLCKSLIAHKSLWNALNATTLSYETELCEDMSLVILLPVCARMVCKVRCYCLQMERENEELCFTVHLEERDNPENLHWDVRKTQTDIIHFRNLWQVRDGRRGRFYCCNCVPQGTVFLCNLMAIEMR